MNKLKNLTNVVIGKLGKLFSQLFLIFFITSLLYKLDTLLLKQNQLDLQLPVQSVPITTKVVSSNPVQARCTRYNIMW